MCVCVFIEVISDFSSVHLGTTNVKVINIGIKHIRCIQVVDMKVHNI